MKARELAAVLMKNPEAEVVVNMPWEALAKVYLGRRWVWGDCPDDYDDLMGVDRCAVAVERVWDGWLPSGVLVIMAGKDIISG